MKFIVIKKEKATVETGGYRGCPEDMDMTGDSQGGKR
jgi:hypothetical protein